MPDHPEGLEEAMEAIRESLIAEGWDDPSPWEIARRAGITADQALASIDEDLRDALQAAEPHLQRMYSERFREAMQAKGPGTARAHAAKALKKVTPSWLRMTIVDLVLDAALDSLTKEGS